MSTLTGHCGSGPRPSQLGGERADDVAAGRTGVRGKAGIFHREWEIAPTPER
jgi:hypothetical protein